MVVCRTAKRSGFVLFPSSGILSLCRFIHLLIVNITLYCYEELCAPPVATPQIIPSPIALPSFVCPSSPEVHPAPIRSFVTNHSRSQIKSNKKYNNTLLKSNNFLIFIYFYDDFGIIEYKFVENFVYKLMKMSYIH